MEFYERLDKSKKTLKLTNEDLGNVVGKKPDAFRLSVFKRSLKRYDIQELELYLDVLENKETKNPSQSSEGIIIKDNNSLIRENEFLKETIKDLLKILGNKL